MAFKSRQRTGAVINKTLLVAGWGFTIVVLVQTLPFSWIAINPQEVKIQGDQVSVHRTFPLDVFGLPRPQISYVETLQPITQGHNKGRPCIDGAGPFPYTRPEPIGRWSIDWANACLDDPVGYYWSARWTWHIGAIRLGPVSLEETVLTN